MSDRGQKLTPALLLNAYAGGVFPMAQSAEDPELYWFDPPLRGVIPLQSFHVPKNLRKRVRRGGFEVTVDQAFEDVLMLCAARPETWINEQIHQLYTALFASGFCHSVEVWMEGELVGGLYGVALGGAFFGESMFSTRADASKIALVYLMARLKHGGFSLLDTQFVTDHLRRFGAHEIPRAEFHIALRRALRRSADFERLTADLPPQEVLQLSTQTS